MKGSYIFLLKMEIMLFGTSEQRCLSREAKKAAEMGKGKQRKEEAHDLDVNLEPSPANLRIKNP